MKFLFCSILLFLIVFSCKLNENVKADQPNNPFSEAYYLQFDNLEERLAQLMSGAFSCYSVRKGGLWTVNNGKDSIIIKMCPVGDPLKDGTWVYREAIMSHFPEKPLVQNLYKIKRLSPDSLELQEYKPKEKDNSYIGIYKKEDRPLKEDELESIGCTHAVKKLSPTEFASYSELCERTRQGGTHFVNMWMNFTPSKTHLETRSWTQPVENMNDTINHDFNHTILIYKRLPVKE